MSISPWRNSSQLALNPDLRSFVLLQVSDWALVCAGLVGAGSLGLCFLSSNFDPCCEGGLPWYFQGFLEVQDEICLLCLMKLILVAVLLVI